MKRSNFLAPLYGICGMLFVLGLLNAPLVVSQASLWITPAQAMAVPVPIADGSVSKDARLRIPRINVDAPLVEGMTAVDDDSVQEALKRGVLHFGGSALPGTGNSVYVGHSSNSVWEEGDYKFIFALLDQLQVGDEFMVTSASVEYRYRVSKRAVVAPSDVSVLAQSTRPIATLITCTPVGTNWNRLVIVGEQISPAPAALPLPVTANTAPALPL